MASIVFIIKVNNHVTVIDFCALVFGHNHLANRLSFFLKLNEMSWAKVHIPRNDTLSAVVKQYNARFCFQDNPKQLPWC